MRLNKMFKEKEYWKVDITWGEVRKGRMRKKDITNRCKDKGNCIDPYISMRLKALKYVGYTDIVNQTGRTIAIGNRIEPRKVDFIRLEKGSRKSISELIKQY